MHFIDLDPGRRFVRWTVLSRDATPAGKKGAWWRCRCDCGTERPVASAYLLSNRSRSCGCLQRDAVTKRPEDRKTAPRRQGAATHITMEWRGESLHLTEVCRRENVSYSWVYARCGRNPTEALIEYAKRAAPAFSERGGCR